MVAQTVSKPNKIIAIPEEEGEYQEVDDLFGKPVTKSQIVIIRLVAEGMRNQQIADTLFLSCRTVETQISLACRRIGLHNRTSLMLWASKNGIV